jgi:hypothetical protein
MAWGGLMAAMPLANSQTGKTKKAKDGSDAVVLDGYIYSLKGGNTQDFYAYDLMTGTWAEKETIPAFGSTAKKKRVKAGGSMATDGHAVYALKGNKSRELWRYVLGMLDAPRITHHARTGVQGVKREASGVTLVCQNPARGRATLRWHSSFDIVLV